MSSTAKNPSAGRTASCPYTSAPPGMSPRKSRTGSPISFKSTPHLITAQTRASRGFQRFRPPFIRTLVRPAISSTPIPVTRAGVTYRLARNNYLDLTPKGRVETGPNCNLTDRVRHHDRYDDGGFVD